MAGTAGVILAAGAGSRFQANGVAPHKLVATLNGKPLLYWPVSAAAQAELDLLIVVCGAVRSGDLAWVVDMGVGDSMSSEKVVLVDNPRWAEGQSSSLQCAVTVAKHRGLDAIVVGLGDQPFTSTTTWSAVARSQSPIAVAQYGARRQPPVRLDRSVWHLLPDEGDFGARHLFEQHPELVSAIVCKDNPVDIDTAEDLRRWN